LQESSNYAGHISSAELAKLLEESLQRAEPVRDAAELHPHLAACLSCREQFETAALARELTSMKASKSEVRQGDCPDRAVWREIAGGLTPVEEVLVSIQHASRCDYCGPLLRGAMAELAVLNGELTQEERSHIASLESARVEWQQKLAQRIAGTAEAEPERERSFWASIFWKPRRGRWTGVVEMAAAGVSLAVVVVAGAWFVRQRHQPATAERLLALAYAQRRTLEPRIAGAAYAPLRVSRGPAASFTSRSPALLKAEALIGAQLQTHPSDPAWLQAKAEGDLLEGKYDAAVESLQRGLEIDPQSSALLIDLATAYFQRAQQEDHKEDFGAAYEYLSRALKLHPDDPVALFNRAIVAEHEFLYHQALEDWERYLQLDSSSQWADEARNHAEAVREKLKARQSEAAPLLTPAEVVAKLTDASLSSNLWSEVDTRVEQYLHEAVVSWLPRAFPEGQDGVIKTNGNISAETSAVVDPQADPQAARALFFLADLTSRLHGDQWLTDVLRGSSAYRFPQAASALALAVRANDTGQHDIARQQGQLAAQLFRASGNLAGSLRAQFEQTLADQVLRHAEECRRRSITAGEESRGSSYTWTQIQFALEQSVCSAQMGDLGMQEIAASRAEDGAKQAGYGALYLRAVGFVADSKFLTGDRSTQWRSVFTGLDYYWSGQFPAMRAYNLYSEEALAAAPEQENLRLAIWREALPTIDGSENLPLRAEAHSRVANAASAANEPGVAKQQYEEAARLYTLAPRTENTLANRLRIEVMTAQLEADQGTLDAALVRLTRVQDEIRRLSSHYLSQVFNTTLAEVQLRSQHPVEAEQTYRAALAGAEQDLASLTSEASRISWSKDAAPVYLGLAETELVQGRQQESLDVFEWYLGAAQHAGTSARDGAPNPTKMLVRPFSVRQIPTGQTVLAFGTLPDGLAIWVSDDRGVSAKWIAMSTRELQDRASNFSAECSDPSSEVNAVRRDGRSLYGELIAPVEEQLAPGRTLVIEAEGWLARVPFEALLDGSGRYLIERAPIVHSLGQDSQARLRNETGIAADLPALVVGSTASSIADGLIPLPGIAAEADAVANDFHAARVLKGGEATLSAVRSALPGAVVFHFAGHALAAPQRTGLLLEKDENGNAPRLLDANAVRHLPLASMQLAVLSACGTASGSGGSSGFDSITDAFLRAGVPHVVASRWAVDSVQAQGLMEEFYRSVLSGQSVSDAIGLISRKMLANPRTSHPYYWSAFAAYGRP
jgi:CHAT domain-containing protein/tetratricopeptide (TPR) repeat protein